MARDTVRHVLASQRWRSLGTMVLFGLLSLVAGAFRVQIPGIEGANSDLREAAVILSALYLPHWGYGLGVALITSSTTPADGSFLSTFCVHSAGVVAAWWYFRIALRRIRSEVLLFFSALAFVAVYYYVILLPLMAFTSVAAGLVATGSPMDAYRAIVGVVPIEVAATAAVTAFCTVAHRVGTERRRLDARYRAIVEDQTDFVVRYAPDGVRTFVNSAYADFFGGEPESFIGTNFLSLISAEHRPAVEEKIRRLVEGEADVIADEHLSQHQDGSLRWTHWVDRAIFDANGKLVELQAVGRDIHQMREAEERLAQAQTMETVGTLASGLAHDLNNTLFVILSHADLIRRASSDPAAVEESARAMRSAAEQASELVESLLQLGRRSPRRFLERDLGEIVGRAGRLLRSVLPSRIEVRLEIENMPLVLVDPVQLTQAVLNLGLNARDAIKERGTIEVSARLSGEDAAAVLVRDDGAGMTPEVRERIFEPFFTTKTEGRGTGLGLAMVSDCAASHGGEVRVESAVGEGTTVELWLPVLRPGVIAARASESEAVDGLATVLVVDDEPLALLHVREILCGGGYSVLAASSCEEALRLPEKELDEVDLVLVDETMPHTSGSELARELRRSRPELPVVLICADLVLPNDEPVIAGVVNKPFSADELLQAVRTTLDGGPEASCA